MSRTSTLFLCLFCLLFAGPVLGQSWPRYANAQTERVIARMIDAHGGMDAWSRIPTLSYEHKMLDPNNPDDPWLSHETIEQGRRRLYQDWPLDKGKLAYDGEKVWTENWGRGNPPGMMAFVSHFFLNLPWITQDSGVTLGDVRRETIPEGGPQTGKTYHVVRLQYDPAATGASEYEYYDLYIDPDTYLMKGVNYTVTYRPLMDIFRVPESVKFMGPLFKYYESHTEVEGLLFPMRYDTYRQGQPYGIHTVENYAVNKPFDESRLKMTAAGVIDSTFTGFDPNGR